MTLGRLTLAAALGMALTGLAVYALTAPTVRPPVVGPGPSPEASSPPADAPGDSTTERADLDELQRELERLRALLDASAPSDASADTDASHPGSALRAWDEQPERDVPTLRYLDKITSLFEHLTHLTRIVDGMFGQLPQRDKMPLEFPTPFALAIRKGFEQLQFIPMLIVTPLTFLGGAFYSIDMLPPTWRTIALLNPVVYLISGFRWSFKAPPTSRWGSAWA